jgi:hypothetical protein
VKIKVLKKPWRSNYTPHIKQKISIPSPSNKYVLQIKEAHSYGNFIKHMECKNKNTNDKGTHNSKHNKPLEHTIVSTTSL